MHLSIAKTQLDENHFYEDGNENLMSHICQGYTSIVTLVSHASLY